MDKFISIEQFCIHHNVDFAFIESLNQYGLVEITTIEDTRYIIVEQIKDVEKMIRMHYELDINIEGIEAIYHLLNKVDSLQEELTILKNKLNRYE
ncbi:MAG: chaperone modulator CbpM [Bacteroidota bacterium]